MAIPCNANASAYNTNASAYNANASVYNTNAIPCNTNAISCNANAIPCNANASAYNVNASINKIVVCCMSTMLAEIRRKIADDQFEFSKHAVDQSSCVGFTYKKLRR
ncbi:MAG: hypothetical protein V7L05_12530 [Nostoc sp.]|uniref:hypothetical protein n=1 Tax=Nostoc sp. TaxID=1180 RepID=UPI002FFA8640